MGKPDLAEQAREIVGRLTAPRRQMVLALPADGSWGAVPDRGVAKREFFGMLPVLVKHKHMPTDRNEWALSPVGLAVRAILQETPDA